MAKRKLPDHFFIGVDGALHDTRNPKWAANPLRPEYRRTFLDIDTTSKFKATLRGGNSAWPGGYPLHFLCSDGEALCFACARNNARLVLRAVADHDRSGWHVIATDINYEDQGLTCANCDKPLEAAYGGG